VPEIVDDGDAVGGAHQLHPPAEPLEGADRGGGSFERHSSKVRGRDRRKPVGDIVLARHR
jgi:hypothetical protein